MSDDALLAILLGWLLGILSSPLADVIRRQYQAKEVRRAILLELGQMRVTLSAVVFGIGQHSGTLDKPLLEWVRLTRTQQEDPTEDSSINEVLEALAALPDAQLGAVVAAKKAPAGTGLSTKSYSLVYTTAHVQNLSLFDGPFQIAVLQIIGRLDRLNADADFLMQQHHRTFDTSLDVVNQTVLRDSIERGYATYARQSRALADMMGTLIARHK